MNIQCAQCGRFIETESDANTPISFCPFCGNRLNTAALPEENQVEETVDITEKSSESEMEVCDTNEEIVHQETSFPKEEPAVAVPTPEIPFTNPQIRGNSHPSVSQVFSAGVNWLKSQKERLETFRKERARQNNSSENSATEVPVVTDTSQENQFVIPTPPLPGSAPAQEILDPEQPIPSPPLPQNSGTGYNYDAKQIIPSPPLPGQKPSINPLEKFKVIAKKITEICGKVFNSVKKIPLRRTLVSVGNGFTSICGRLRKIKTPRIPFRKINYSRLILLACGIVSLLLGIRFLASWNSPQIQVGCILLTIGLIWLFFRNPTSHRFSRFTAIFCFLSTLVAGTALAWCTTISPKINFSWVLWNGFRIAVLFLAGIALFITTFNRSFWKLPANESKPKPQKTRKAKVSGPPIKTSKLVRPSKAWAEDNQSPAVPKILPVPNSGEKVSSMRKLEQPVTRLLILLVFLELGWLGWGMYKAWNTQKICDRFAEKGIAPAQYWSASICLNELNPHQEFERGMELLEASAHQHYAPANERFAQILFDNGSRSSEVFENWKIAAECGRRDSMKSLALCYANGWGTDRDENEMVFWLQKAANLGQAEAQYHLAMAYWDGKGTVQNDQQAIYWLNSSASHKNPDALYFLGKITFEGERVTPFQAQGVEYLLLASTLGNEKASEFLKNFFCEKNGMEICPEPGLDWLITCSDSEENDWAVERLNLYFSQEKGLEKHPVKGFKWIEKQAKYENPVAAMLLAHCYLNGDLVDQNEEQGIVWLTKSAESNLLVAQKELADDYYQGIHTQKNLETAYLWYNRAMKQNDLDSQFSVANCKYCGRGTIQDQPEGIDHWVDAARQGHEPSREKLNEIFINEDGLVNLQDQGISWLQQEEKNGNIDAKRKLEQFYQENQTTPEALAFFEKKAREGDVDAQLKIGRIYLYGLGTKQDVSLGFGWLKKAYLQGKSEAGVVLDEFCFQQDSNSPFLNEAIAWLEKRAEDGNVRAQLRVGEICLEKGTQQYIAKGFKWLQKAEDNIQAEPEDQAKAVQILDNFSFRQESNRKFPEETIAWLEKRADDGYVRAQLQVGKIYLEGKVVPKDSRKATSFLKDAADENSEAILLLDEYFVENDTLPEPAQEGIGWLERRSNEGSETAQLKLANYYLQGTYVQKNPSKAIIHLEKAAKQKNPEALLLLGECYQQGLGTSKNLSKAFECFQESATGGNVEAQCQAAHCCKEGIGTSKDLTAAASYWKSASEAGNCEALYEYGKCCSTGEGTAQNLGKAARCFSKAAAQGHCEAQLEYGKCCLYGQGMAVNPSEGVQNIAAAAAQGNDEALAIYGECCILGKGTVQNRSLGLQKLLTAEKNGWKPAGESLKKFLLNGENTDSDLQKSEIRVWIEKQADDGDSSARLLIGKAMYEGNGWKKDRKKAVALLEDVSKDGNKEAESILIKWFLEDKDLKPSDGPILRRIKELADDENPDALVYLGKCNLYAWGMEENLTQAFALFQKAAILGNADGQYWLGRCYEFGYGTKKSPSESNAWYKKASLQGHAKAKERLVEPKN